MGKLSDIKLNKLKTMSDQGGFWYITKQNLIFRDLCFMAKILEKWNDRSDENFENFFDRCKVLPEYGKFPNAAAHRGTKNCEYIGLIRPSNKYSSNNLTPFYFSLKELCHGDFNNISLYSEIVDAQLERIYIDSQNKIPYTNTFQICPFMFLFKILLLIGDITNSYKISTSEFKLFVATAQNWNDYFEVVESILRYRDDDDFRAECDANNPKVSDVRYNLLAQNHSQLYVTKSEIAIKEDQIKNIRRKVAEYELKDTVQSAEDMFNSALSPSSDQPRQQIFYGAPGTGKSHGIKKRLEELEVPKENVFRTTFHPDSDYSSFVGAYKPTMKKQYRYDGKVKAKYYEDDDLADAKKDDVIVDKVIQYDFIPQTFIKAYVRAYQTTENVYLIIEEINRGNCAQIFGDLFQLLDRDDDGVSEYTIKADADLRTYLEDALGKDADGIKDGELCLPSNLYIWATMNTSDQSLFPIDSAFKRRWDWKYEPIKYENSNWKIEIGGAKYLWTDFQKTVNNKIFGDTSSEDKMLGDYFVNPPTGIISEDLFLNKILFYLWNDVCKDGDGDIFKTEDNKDVKFSDLYGENGTTILLSMMRHLEVKPTI